MYTIDIHYTGHYRHLNKVQRQVVNRWIRLHIRNVNLWDETSYGLKCRFEQSPNGFPISSGQFKRAMLKAGYQPVTFSPCDDWIFMSRQRTRRLH